MYIIEKLETDFWKNYLEIRHQKPRFFHPFSYFYPKIYLISPKNQLFSQIQR